MERLEMSLSSFWGGSILREREASQGVPKNEYNSYPLRVFPWKRRTAFEV